MRNDVPKNVWGLSFSPCNPKQQQKAKVKNSNAHATEKKKERKREMSLTEATTKRDALSTVNGSDCDAAAVAKRRKNDETTTTNVRALARRRCDVEVRLTQNSTAEKKRIREHVLDYFERKGSVEVFASNAIELERNDGKGEEEETMAFLRKNCEKITFYFDDRVEESVEKTPSLMFYEIDFRVHVHEINEDGAGEEREDDDEIATYKEYALPCREFSEYWDSLYFDDDTKSRLKNYAQTALEFGNLNVNASLVAFNRVVLLHGPPGTGKTTMCKGLAQKLAIQMLDTYSEPVLVEINAHSLFSKWFSESGKLVGKLFEKIQELTEDEDTFVFVLVDEVESLAAARKATGSEPSDAIRVVNALLTQLDALKEKKNAMVLTTSNVTEAIDVAFIDRADVKVYVGNPGHIARREIMMSWLIELARVGIIDRCPENYICVDPSGKLEKATEGLSGRALRKLPFLTFAGINRTIGDGPMKLEDFLEAVYEKATSEKREREKLVLPKK